MIRETDFRFKKKKRFDYNLIKKRDYSKSIIA